MNRISLYLLAVIMMVAGTPALAQEPEMADTFRADGKIYVVVAIVLIILIGLISYVFFLDRKASKIEKLLEEKGKTK